MAENIDNSTTANEEVEMISVKKRHKKPDDGRGKFFVLRQILNIIFMIGAIAAVILVLKDLDLYGMIIALIAMAFKMAECVLRYVK